MDDEPEISVLDARLAEIDRRLHSIQSGLADGEAAAEPITRIQTPGQEPGGDTAPTESSAETAAEMINRLRELTTAQEAVLASMRELLGAVERVAVADPLARPLAPAAIPPAAGAGPPLGVSAGPFASTEALRSFQAELESLPEVRAVELRGFEGGDRAILDVHL